MAMRHFVALAIGAALVFILLLSWLLPFFMRSMLAVFALLMVYAGVRVLVGPSTPVPLSGEGSENDTSS